MIYEQLVKDRNTSRGNDVIKYNIIGVIIGEIQRKYPNPSEAPETHIFQIMKNMFNGIKETLKFNPSDTTLLQEKIIIEGYLPRSYVVEVVKLTHDEIYKILDDLIQEDSNYLNNRKMIFDYMKEHYNGRYDGSIINEYMKK